MHTAGGTLLFINRLLTMKNCVFLCCLLKIVCYFAICLLLLLLSCCYSHVQLCVTPQMAAHQAPPSLGFSGQEHWSGLPFPSPMLICLGFLNFLYIFERKKIVLLQDWDGPYCYTSTISCSLPSETCQDCMSWSLFVKHHMFSSSQ